MYYYIKKSTIKFSYFGLSKCAAACPNYRGSFFFIQRECAYCEFSVHIPWAFRYFCSLCPALLPFEPIGYFTHEKFSFKKMHILPSERVFVFRKDLRKKKEILFTIQH